MVFSIRVVPVFMLQWPVFFNSNIDALHCNHAWIHPKYLESTGEL